MKVFKNPLAFEWDEGNKDKNFIKHKVTNEECEEIFFDTKKKIADDIFHSGKEQRSIIIGKTKLGRYLFLVFTTRYNKIRIISARDLDKKGRSLYEKEN
ncbi:MAG: BrnT family toxin [Candidatus Berkelbacteria bacterium]|nr:BrnT family toxin [Candidatus Berkelbacteria bacterium]